MSLHH